MPSANYIEFEGQLTSSNTTFFTLTVESLMANSFTALVFRYIIFMDQYAADGSNLLMRFLRLDTGGVEINNST